MNMNEGAAAVSIVFIIAASYLGDRALDIWEKNNEADQTNCIVSQNDLPNFENGTKAKVLVIQNADTTTVELKPSAFN